MLSFHLGQGAKLQHQKAFAAIAKANARNKKGVVLPDVASSAPAVQVPFLWLWVAFCALSEKRWRGGDTAYPQPIPTSEIASYATIRGLDDRDDRLTLYAVVSALDTLFVKDYWEKLIEQNKNAQNQGRRQPR